MSILKAILPGSSEPRGEQAAAQVISVQQTNTRLGPPTGGASAYQWKIHALVRPENAPEFETTVKDYFAYESAPCLGACFTVRCEPGKQKAKIDHTVPGTFAPDAVMAPPAHRYGYKQAVGGVPAAVFERPSTAGIAIDLRNR
jgi:hypothetical protein